jgi:hypothetical protein
MKHFRFGQRFLFTVHDRKQLPVRFFLRLRRKQPGFIDPLGYALERIKWYLWHGNVLQALNELQSLEMDLDAAAFESKNENSQKLLKGVEELHTYVERNQEFVPNYGERYRNGERIASGFVESAINQVVSKRMVKKQQMGWSQRGAHLLLQIRTRVLDEEWENTFRRWYPDFRPRAQAKKAA